MRSKYAAASREVVEDRLTGTHCLLHQRYKKFLVREGGTAGEANVAVRIVELDAGVLIAPPDSFHPLKGVGLRRRRCGCQGHFDFRHHNGATLSYQRIAFALILPGDELVRLELRQVG